MNLGQLADGDFSTSGRTKSCKVSPEVWLSTWGKRPTLASVEERDGFKIKNDDDDVSSCFCDLCTLNYSTYLTQ